MTSTPDALDVLGPHSYTAQRLQHATPEHVHLTSRRCFIGPIPEGWLQSHRRDWYKHHLRIHYSSRAATFTAPPNVGKHRRLTGIEGPSAIASHGYSFPQPEDVDEQDGDDAEEDEWERHDLRITSAVESHDHDAQGAHADATTTLPPAVDVPRTQHVGDDPQPSTTNAQDEQPPSEHDEMNLLNAPAPLEAVRSTPAEQKENQGLHQSTEAALQASLEDASSNKEVLSHAKSTETRRQSSSSSLDTVRPPVTKRSSSEANNRPAEANVERGQPHVPNAKEESHSKQHSDSSGSTAIWLSPPTSRLPSSRDSPALRPKYSGSSSQVSFVTANEEAASTHPRLESVAEVDTGSGSSAESQTLQQQQSSSRDEVPTTTAPSSRESSHASLIQHGQHDGTHDEPESDVVQFIPPETVAASQRSSSKGKRTSTAPVPGSARAQTGLVRFETVTNEEERQRMMKARLAQMRKRDTFKRIRRGVVHDGQIVKVENLLVRLEFTVHKVPDEFSENDSEKIETTLVERWKEFMCVCRENDDDDCPFVLQLYKSRVIPAIERTHVKKRWTHEIQLRRSNCHVNLYSSLDKSMVIWHPCRRGTLMFTMQSRCGANSMEWYTFLRNILGCGRASVLQVNIPDLALNLRLDKPFEALESVRDVAQAADGDEQAILRTMKEERAATARIVARCMKMLHESPDWNAVLDHWHDSTGMGLAWKRYDRLEWVHGANEKKMYGTMAMEKTHELELRPKQHYPTSVRGRRHQLLTEPPAIEGFLIRLTSQKGVDQRLGKLFFKRLYFSTHDQFLVFNRPARADPPPPPRLPMTQDAHIPTAEQIAQTTPLIYEVNPFAVKDGQIAWLSAGDGAPPPQIRKHDQDAFDENHRRLGLLSHCDGLVNLCDVARVRHAQRGATPADDRVGSGSDVDFDQSVPNTARDDGTTADMDDARVFELVLRNGLVIRLQSYDGTTKREWMTRLRALMRYWQLRTRADIALYKSVRAQNLARLQIDEQSEAYVGQFADKWEVRGSYASPELYNMCGIGCCRSLHMSGELYHKPRLHGVFQRMLCLLSHGALLMFAAALRRRDGTLLPHIHREHTGTLDLRDCYIYSGLAAARDLLYAATDHTDRHRAGRHGLPRMWPADGWRSMDEDTSTCFVIWHGKKSGWFRSQDDAPPRGDAAADASEASDAASRTRTRTRTRDTSRQRLRRVKKLGTEGKSIVFRARSRAEKDHWVLSIGMEIERVQQQRGGEGADVRFVEGDE